MFNQNKDWNGLKKSKSIRKQIVVVEKVTYISIHKFCLSYLTNYKGVLCNVATCYKLTLKTFYWLFDYKSEMFPDNQHVNYPNSCINIGGLSII